MLLEYISLASGLNFMFLAIVLYRRNKQNLKSTIILIRLLICMAVYTNVVFVHYIAVEKCIESVLFVYLPLDGVLLAMLAPCLYYYVMAVIEVPVSLTWKTVLLHSLAFIPFIAFNVYFFTLSQIDRVDWLYRDFQQGTLENNILNVVLYVQIIVYLVISYIQVVRKIKQMKISTYQSVIPDLNWLKLYLKINLIYTILSLPVCFYFANEEANIIIGQLAMNIQFVYLFFIVSSNANNNGQTSNALQTKLRNRNLNQDIADSQFVKLNTYINEFKPHLSESCSLQTLSEQTGIPQYLITNLINSKLNQTFPDYINQLRIQEAHQLLLTDNTNNHTIESIAHACGFGSKSAFNRAFKKFSQNHTPKEFIRKQKK